MNFRYAALSSTILAACLLFSIPIQAQQLAADPVAKAAHDKQVREWKHVYGEGPYPDEIDGFVNARHEPLRPYFKALYTGGERNAVLNLSRLGLAAMELGQWRDAEHAFDAALIRIESVYAKNKQAEAARSLFHKESNKDWKGEPYERAMAYYYRGLLYLRKGDYNNAHAAFKGAEYQDTVSETEEFQNDFALMDFLVGWSSQCAGDSGQTDFAAATTAQAKLAAPAAGDNVLFVAEMGHGPVKAKDGKQREKLVFHPAVGYPETGAIFSLTPLKGAPVALNTHFASSIYYQATTRGGRAMDGILDGKASWKSGTQAVGTATTLVGLKMMNQYNGNASAGAAVAVAGLLFSAFATAMKTDVDIRQWDSLPDNVALATTHTDGVFTPTVAYTGADGSVTLLPAIVMQSTAGRCSVIWSRSRSALMEADTPGDDLKVRAAVARKKDAIAKDKAFRSELSTSYAELR